MEQEQLLFVSSPLLFCVVSRCDWAVLSTCCGHEVNQKFGALVNNQTTVFIAVRIREDSFHEEQNRTGNMECLCGGLLITCCGQHFREGVVVVARSLEMSTASELGWPTNLNVIPQSHYAATTRPLTKRSVLFNTTNRQDKPIAEPYQSRSNSRNENVRTPFWDKHVRVRVRPAVLRKAYRHHTHLPHLFLFLSLWRLSDMFFPNYLRC